MIRVLIVEDSISISQIIQAILESDNNIQVAEVLTSGESAVEYVKENHVDIITMDFNLYGMDGITATKKIMSISPKPIVIMSSTFDPKNSKDVFRAIDAGALSVFEKPNSLGSESFNQYAKDLIRHIKLLSEIKVVTRRKRKTAITNFNIINNKTESQIEFGEKKIKLIAIGSSTGGPQVLKKIFSSLNSGFPIPIVAVQHISLHFTEPMVKWLNDECEIKIEIAINNEHLLPGKIYFAPDSKHLTISKDLRIILDDSFPINSSKPSVSKLFESIASTMASNSVGILLTGMGRDGAKELADLKAAGGITIAQNEQSSVVFGMPHEAIKLNGATFIYNPTEIINFLQKIGEETNANANFHR